MDEKKLKAIVASVYVALCVVVAVLLIDIQIKNAILDQAAKTRRELDRLQADLEVSNGLIGAATGSGRIDYFPVVPAVDIDHDGPGVSVENLAREVASIGGADQAELWDQVDPATDDGPSDVPPAN